ncbi:uncharacterized protein LOC128330618 isoform X2 [Hemicordylus capensis]|uniref:uncharacterized protein LOC128330618 isoform X2 n=1 Tax=Hemicordylus capensis TaxID=884348 RepID=UPI0023044C18|nr:uncharacterized protein LOC128330618 isoform X2 [Hemicordylus capensis]
MSTSCTVRVRGFPTDLPPERVTDKLTIHFLRARNGGGEIVNIEFAPDSPDCAVVTFEDAAVTQQVLMAEKHVLSVNGKNYPLEVTTYPTELNPNEVFVHVYMKIDYGCFPGGKDILCDLRKQYGSIQFNFNSQAATCSVKGPFTELEAFSSELLRCLRGKQRISNSTVQSGRSANKVAGSRVLEMQEEKEKKNGKGVAGSALPHRNPTESNTEPLEDFSLVIDSDIYLYMQTFCRKELSNILQRHQVDVVDVNNDGVTTLYLQAASVEAGGVSALVAAHLAVSQLSQQLEITLRKEKISKRDLGAGGGKGLPAELQDLCPLLLCLEDEGHFYLIGNLVEVSRAKQYIQDVIAARGMVQDPQKADDPHAAGLALIQGRSPVPAQPKSPEESVPRKLSSPRSNGKSECKLAAKFSSRASCSYLPNQGTLLEGQLSQDLSHTADSQTPDSQPLPQVMAAAPRSESQIRQSAKLGSAPPGMKVEPSQRISRGTMLGTEGRTSIGFTQTAPLHVASSTLRSLNLFDTTGAVDLKAPETRPLLRRSNSSLLLKHQTSSEPKAEPSWPSARVSEHHLQQKDLRHTLQEEMGKGGMTRMAGDFRVESWVTEQGLSSPTSLPVQRNDGDWMGPSAMQKVEALAAHPDYICGSFSYSELAMEGPDDEALAHLCSYLRECHDQVLINRDRYKLELAYPREVKLQVVEAFRFFSAQRVAALSEQRLSHGSQQGSHQDELSSPAIQRSPPKESSRASLLENPPHLSSLAGERPSSQHQRFLDLNGFQPTVAQTLPSDQRAWPSKTLDKVPDAIKQGRPGKSAIEVKRGLPDKFHFGRDRGKERCGREAEWGPSSLPLLPLSFSAPVSLQAIGKRSPPAGEGEASDLDRRAASPGREPPTGECELCRSTQAATSRSPCGHALCEACFSVGGVPPPCCRASPAAIPGSFTATTISQSLPGYFRDPTLKITYNIPSGVQQARDPHPGHPYRGGYFEAFLPDNPEGQRLMVLLQMVTQMPSISSMSA